MTVTCITCSNWQPRKSDKGHVAVGMATCAIHSGTRLYPSFGADRERECTQFKPAEASTVAARRKYEDRPRKTQ